MDLYAPPMSWGFYCDLDVTLPTADFQRIWKTKTNVHAFPSPIFGFESDELERMFTVSRGSEEFPNVPLKNLVRWFKSYSGRSTTTEERGETTFRGCMCIDRGGDPWIARTVAALFYAAQASGRGHLLLVNDGAYSGESGVLLRLAKGEVVRSLVVDSRPARAVLFAALFEGKELPSAEELFALTASTESATRAPSKKKVAAKRPGADRQ